MRFWWMYATAWIRGLFYRWPKQAPIPPRYSGCSCALKSLSEVRAMWEHRWEPWCFQRIPAWKQCGPVSRLFRIPLTLEEIEYQEMVGREWTRMADEYYAEEARRMQ